MNKVGSKMAKLRNQNRPHANDPNATFNTELPKLKENGDLDMTETDWYKDSHNKVKPHMYKKSPITYYSKERLETYTPGCT